MNDQTKFVRALNEELSSEDAADLIKKGVERIEPQVRARKVGATMNVPPLTPRGRVFIDRLNARGVFPLAIRIANEHGLFVEEMASRLSEVVPKRRDRMTAGRLDLVAALRRLHWSANELAHLFSRSHKDVRLWLVRAERRAA